MRKGPFSDINQGAVAGAVVAGVGSLFAIWLASAIINWNQGQGLEYLGRSSGLILLSWVICTPTGWVLGGAIGPRVGERLRSQRAELIAGGIGGLVPVLIVAGYGWYLALQP